MRVRRKFGRFWRRLPALLLTLTALAGCNTRGYYQECAVERARDFLLSECPDIPLYEQEYIKFNRPVFLTAPITKGYATGVSQICITWVVPDNPEYYMVYGTSGANMIEWSPIRIIRKNFTRPDKNYLAVSDLVRNTLLQSQYSLLSAASVNHLRYTLPGVWKCRFPLDFNPETPYSGEELKRASELPRYVLAWLVTEGGREYYVFGGGTAGDDKLTGFKLYFSGMLEAERFREELTAPEPLIAPFGGVPDNKTE